MAGRCSSPNVYQVIDQFRCSMVNTQVLGKAFEPEEGYENPDGTPITFDRDYLGNHRGAHVLPGPFASPLDAQNKPLVKKPVCTPEEVAVYEDNVTVRFLQ